MFGSNENQIERLVKKRQWDKAGKKLRGADANTRLAFAAACGDSSDEEAINFLIDLIKDNDENVQAQAVKSLGAIGSENGKTHLQWLYDHLPAGKDALRGEIQKSIEKIGAKN